MASIYSSARGTKSRYGTGMSAMSLPGRPSRSSTSLSSLTIGRGASGLAGRVSGYGISTGSAMGSAVLRGGGGLITDEKNAMQNLNQRLANYMEQVNLLEKSNKELEIEIRNCGANRTLDGFDWSMYDKMVIPLQQQILNAILENSRIALEVDNAKLAAEDFKNKWESELILRQSVENDIGGLHQLKDTYLQLQSDLAREIAGLEDEIAFLRKNHQEELKVLRQQKTQDIHVEVDSGPSVDVAAAMQEMRDSYTKLVDTNQKDLDNWYQQQVQVQNTQVMQNTQALTSGQVELTGLRQQIQTLDADYNALYGSLAALQNSLENTEARYDMELQRLLSKCAQLEGELGSIRNNLTVQTQDYQTLLNLKMKLEAEIQDYKSLLEGGNQNLVGRSSSSGMSLGGSSTIITTSTIEREVAT
ncbi:keratin, type I cytoskeletal 18-like [Scyliorhinus torazame]